MVIALVHGPETSGKTRKLIKAHQLAEKYQLTNATITPHVPDTEPRPRLSTSDDRVSLDGVGVIGGTFPLPNPSSLHILYVDNAQHLTEDEVAWILKRYGACQWIIFYARQYLPQRGTQAEYPIFALLRTIAHITDALPGTCKYCKAKCLSLHPVRGKRHRTNYICDACLTTRGREELKL
jgi:thymidine kinase